MSPRLTPVILETCLDRELHAFGWAHDCQLGRMQFPETEGLVKGGNTIRREAS